MPGRLLSGTAGGLLSFLGGLPALRCACAAVLCCAASMWVPSLGKSAGDTMAIGTVPPTCALLLPACCRHCLAEPCPSRQCWHATRCAPLLALALCRSLASIPFLGPEPLSFPQPPIALSCL